MRTFGDLTTRQNERGSEETYKNLNRNDLGSSRDYTGMQRDAAAQREHKSWVSKMTRDARKLYSEALRLLKNNKIDDYLIVMKSHRDIYNTFNSA